MNGTVVECKGLFNKNTKKAFCCLNLIKIMKKKSKIKHTAIYNSSPYLKNRIWLEPDPHIIVLKRPYQVISNHFVFPLNSIELFPLHAFLMTVNYRYVSMIILHHIAFVC